MPDGMDEVNKTEGVVEGEGADKVCEPEKAKGGSKKTGIIVGSIIGALVIAGVAVGIIVAQGGGVPEEDDDDDDVSVTQVYTDLKEVRVKGMTVKEACRAVKAEGWSVKEVIGKNSSLNKSSCSDDESEVVSVTYVKEKYDKWGDLRSDYETVTFKFDDEEDEDDDLDTSSSTSSDAADMTDSSSGSSAASGYDWRAFLADYEKWVDSYVTFMIKYRDADAADLVSMVSDYSKMLMDLAEWSDKAEQVQESLTAGDLADYLDELNRITRKMSEIQ